MSTLMIVLLCIDAALVFALFAYVVVSVVCGEKVAETAPAQAPVEQKPAQLVQEVAVSQDKPEEVEDGEDDRTIVNHVPFAQKMLLLDAKTQIYYDTLHNAFCAMRKINPRISQKGVSYRLGRELVARITVRGKTMRLHLALKVEDFEQNVYFQKDLSDVKSYAEIPLMVKVKSDRGLKNALKLVDALSAQKGIEKKARYTAKDSIAELKA